MRIKDILNNLKDKATKYSKNINNINEALDKSQGDINAFKTWYKDNKNAIDGYLTNFAITDIDNFSKEDLSKWHADVAKYCDKVKIDSLSDYVKSANNYIDNQGLNALLKMDVVNLTETPNEQVIHKYASYISEFINIVSSDLTDIDVFDVKSRQELINVFKQFASICKYVAPSVSLHDQDSNLVNLRSNDSHVRSLSGYYQTINPSSSAAAIKGVTLLHKSKGFNVSRKTFYGSKYDVGRIKDMEIKLLGNLIFNAYDHEGRVQNRFRYAKRGKFLILGFNPYGYTEDNINYCTSGNSYIVRDKAHVNIQDNCNQLFKVIDITSTVEDFRGFTQEYVAQNVAKLSLIDDNYAETYKKVIDVMSNIMLDNDNNIKMPELSPIRRSTLSGVDDPDLSIYNCNNDKTAILELIEKFRDSEIIIPMAFSATKPDQLFKKIMHDSRLVGNSRMNLYFEKVLHGSVLADSTGEGTADMNTPNLAYIFGQDETAKKVAGYAKAVTNLSSFTKNLKMIEDNISVVQDNELYKSIKFLRNAVDQFISAAELMKLGYSDELQTGIVKQDNIFTILDFDPNDFIDAVLLKSGVPITKKQFIDEVGALSKDGFSAAINQYRLKLFCPTGYINTSNMGNRLDASQIVVSNNTMQPLWMTHLMNAFNNYDFFSKIFINTRYSGISFRDTLARFLLAQIDSNGVTNQDVESFGSNVDEYNVIPIIYNNSTFNLFYYILAYAVSYDIKARSNIVVINSEGMKSNVYQYERLGYVRMLRYLDRDIKLYDLLNKRRFDNDFVEFAEAYNTIVFGDNHLHHASLGDNFIKANKMNSVDAQKYLLPYGKMILSESQPTIFGKKIDGVLDGKLYDPNGPFHEFDSERKIKGYTVFELTNDNLFRYAQNLPIELFTQHGLVKTNLNDVLYQDCVTLRAIGGTNRSQILCNNEPVFFKIDKLHGQRDTTFTVDRSANDLSDSITPEELQEFYDINRDIICNNNYDAFTITLVGSDSLNTNDRTSDLGRIRLAGVKFFTDRRKGKAERSEDSYLHVFTRRLDTHYDGNHCTLNRINYINDWTSTVRRVRDLKTYNLPVTFAGFDRICDLPINYEFYSTPHKQRGTFTNNLYVDNDYDINISGISWIEPSYSPINGIFNQSAARDFIVSANSKRDWVIINNGIHHDQFIHSLFDVLRLCNYPIYVKDCNINVFNRYISNGSNKTDGNYRIVRRVHDEAFVCKNIKVNKLLNLDTDVLSCMPLSTTCLTPTRSETIRDLTNISHSWDDDDHRLILNEYGVYDSISLRSHIFNAENIEANIGFNIETRFNDQDDIMSIVEFYKNKI